MKLLSIFCKGHRIEEWSLPIPGGDLLLKKLSVTHAYGKILLSLLWKNVICLVPNMGRL